jgi:phytoene dehydrogenase-like protein
VAHAHPLDGGRAGVMYRSLAETVLGLGVDGRAWERHIGWTAKRWDQLAPSILGPLARVPRHPLTMGAFGARALLPATVLARAFKTDEARGLFGGAAAHSFLALTKPFTASLGMGLLAPVHVAGWPVPRGGSQAIAAAMASRLDELGATIEVGRPVRSLADVPESRVVLFDVTPRQLLAICGDALPATYRRRMARFRYGPAAFKVDYALSEPVPWTNESCRRSMSVHLGGTLEEITASEGEVAAGRTTQNPFMLVGQQSLADPSRAPAGKHTLWTYCHVPNGSGVDMVDAMERQIERFAPGFRDTVLARHVADPAWFEAHNENLVGGDIAGGSHGGLQLVLRPRLGVSPYRTPDPRLFVCSASTPPGGGVHGMCGLHAANAALRTTLK